MKVSSLLFVAIILFQFNVHAYRDVKSDVNILAECQWNKKFAAPDADCNDLFHHYPPVGTSTSANKSNVRLGSFNIYKMGYSETKYKDLDLIAEMMDSRWDVVALSELQHNMSKKLYYNAQAVVADRPNCNNPFLPYFLRQY